MEHDTLKDIFRNFNPPLSDDTQFMNRLIRNMESVKLLKEHTARVRAVHRRAVIIAGVAGFIAGFLASLALPYIDAFVCGLRDIIPSGSVSDIVASNYLVVAWLIIGAMAVFSAVSAYDLSLSFMNTKARERVNLS